jgi:hypothetical protein
MIYGTKNAMNVTMDVIVVIKNVATIIVVKAGVIAAPGTTEIAVKKTVIMAVIVMMKIVSVCMIAVGVIVAPGTTETAVTNIASMAIIVPTNIVHVFTSQDGARNMMFTTDLARITTLLLDA